MTAVQYLLELLFPRKCVLCGRILGRHETDLCRKCRIEAPEFSGKRKEIPFVEEWTAVWRYEEDVRHSLLRFKFYNARGNAEAYGRLLAMRLVREELADFDVMTWVPIGRLRRWERGYDQVELVAEVVGRELAVQPVKLLKKVRSNRRQSGLDSFEARKANVLGAYQAVSPEGVKGKRILLLDDILTTGATMSECARVLLTAGAKEVNGAVVAAASHNKK